MSGWDYFWLIIVAGLVLTYVGELEGRIVRLENQLGMRG